MILLCGFLICTSGILVIIKKNNLQSKQMMERDSINASPKAEGTTTFREQIYVLSEDKIYSPIRSGENEE